MDPLPTTPTPHLEWSHVAIGLTFVAFNSAISQALHLQAGASLAIAALRCVVQLTIVATVLQHVFAAKNPWAVVGIAILLNTLGTVETVVIKARRRYRHMFSAVLFAMLVSTIPVAILGVQFAMRVVPFWIPGQFIPVLGMLCGNAIVGILVSQSYILKELDENRDKTETLLAFGASRFEACRPLAVEAVRLALMPTINQMSVMGIISIPGMMTGAILGGADVEQAARLQMVIMFMISASSALSCIVVTLFTLYDGMVMAAVSAVWAIVSSAWRAGALFRKRMLREGIVGNGDDRRSERTPLLA